MSSVKEMTEGKCLPLIFRFTLPVLLGNLLQQTYSLIDAAIVGRFLGIYELAAVGASSSVIFLILGFCNGCCGGFGIPIAQKFGARDYSLMRRYIHSSIVISAILSVVIALITSLLCDDILKLLTTPDNIFENAYIYLLITFIGIPFTFFYNLLSCIIRAMGDSKTPFDFLVLCTILNILLDLLFVIVFQWGVAGAAIATIAAQAVSAALCLVYMRRKYDILKSTPEERQFDSSIAYNLIAIGTPMGLQFSITAIGSMMLQSANNGLGATCVAAFTAGMRLKMFFICALESIGIAMATFAGQNYGAGKPERIWQGVKASGLMALIYWLFSMALLLPGTQYMVLLFVDASETIVIQDATLFMNISVFFFPMLGALCILRYTIQGIGYTNLAMLSGVSEMIARVLISILLVPIYGYVGVCIGDPTAWIAAVVFLVPAFWYVYRKTKIRT